MPKKTFVTLDQIKEITRTYPTPFHLYDEKGIRDTVSILRLRLLLIRLYLIYLRIMTAAVTAHHLQS